MTWRRRGHVEPSVASELPEWLTTLAGVLPSIDTQQVTRFTPVEGTGRHAAVLVLFDGRRNVVLIERARGATSHSGQPAFPGGVVESFDADAAAAALREAREETGLDPSGVRIFGSLPDLWVPVSGFVVSPMLGYWAAPSKLAVQDPAEVSRVEQISIDVLVAPSNRVTVVHPSGFRGPGFQVHDMLVWGFTAGVLDALVHIAGWSRPWDVHREVMIEG